MQKRSLDQAKLGLERRRSRKMGFIKENEKEKTSRRRRSRFV